MMKEILVCNSAAISGVFASTGDPIVAGIKAYFDMINAQGGVNGYRFALNHMDDEYDPDIAQTCFEKLVFEEKAFAYISHFGAPVVRSTLKCIKETGIPVIGFATGVGELYSDGMRSDMRNVFPIQPVYITEGRAMVARLISMNQNKSISKIGMLYVDESTGRDIKNGVGIESLLLDIDCEFQKINKSFDNVDVCARRIIDSGADFIVVGASQAYFARVIEALVHHKNTKPVLTTYLNSVITVAYQTDAVLQNLFDVYALSWLNYDDKRALNLEIASEWLCDYAMNGYAHCGWISAHFFVEGIKRLGDAELTWDNFIDAMEQEDFEIPFGGKVSYKNGRRLGTLEMSIVQFDMTFPTGWRPVDGLKSFTELLNMNQFYA
ncbi:ABC transporter substrate-binding protein [Bengtsoniella intestinalis]|uniref:ABC transporter substrate-binding protein n=1 Tax=Bengtsoniella intestinalis TaxID=3073143 RepID=UPI00391EF641